MYETWALFTIDAYNRFGGITATSGQNKDNTALRGKIARSCDKFLRGSRNKKKGTEQLKRENRTPYYAMCFQMNIKHGITQFHTIPGNYAHGLSSTSADSSIPLKNNVHQR